MQANEKEPTDATMQSETTPSVTTEAQSTAADSAVDVTMKEGLAADQSGTEPNLAVRKSSSTVKNVDE